MEYRKWDSWMALGWKSNVKKTIHIGYFTVKSLLKMKETSRKLAPQKNITKTMKDKTSGKCVKVRCLQDSL